MSIKDVRWTCCWLTGGGPAKLSSSNWNVGQEVTVVRVFVQFSIIGSNACLRGRTGCNWVAFKCVALMIRVGQHHQRCAGTCTTRCGPNWEASCPVYTLNRVFFEHREQLIGRLAGCYWHLYNLSIRADSIIGGDASVDSLVGSMKASFVSHFSRQWK